MDPIVYILALMGCADDGAMCQKVRVEPVTFSNAAQCQAAMPAVLGRNTDLAYPTITAACQQRSERAARAEIEALAAG